MNATHIAPQRTCDVVLHSYHKLRAACSSRLASHYLFHPRLARCKTGVAASQLPSPVPMAADIATALWLTVAGGIAASLSPSPRRQPAVLLFSRAALAALAVAFAVHSRGGHGADTADYVVRLAVRQAPTPAIVPPPASSPDPSPSSAPAAAAPATAGNDAAETGGGAGAGGVVSDGQPRFVKPTLEECRPAMLRMQVVLLIELILEAFFVLVGCIIMQEKVLRKKLRKWFTTWRIIYLFPVAVLNLSIVWLGSAPTGSCLQYHDVVRLLYVHLGLYLFYNLVLVTLSFLCSKTCQQCVGGAPVDNDCNPQSERVAKSNWGQGRGGNVHEENDDPAYMWEYAEQDPARCQVDCCKWFRLEA